MARLQLSLRELQEQLADIGERFPNLKDDEIFVAWFLRAL